MTAAAETVLAGGLGQIAAAVICVLFYLAVIAAAALGVIGLVVTLLGRRHDRRHPPAGEIGDDAIALIREARHADTWEAHADGMTEALRRITEEDRRG